MYERHYFQRHWTLADSRRSVLRKGCRNEIPVRGQPPGSLVIVSIAAFAHLNRYGETVTKVVETYKVA